MPANLIDQVAVWWAADKGVLPSADGWSSFGTGTATLTDDGARLSASGASFGYTRRFDARDTATRIEDELFVQAQFRGVSQTPAWGGGGTPVIGLILSDGDRRVGVVIGDRVAIVDIGSSQKLLEAEDHYPWLQATTVRLQKIGTVSWEVWCNGRKLLEIPYQWAPQVTPASRAETTVGLLDPTGTGVVVVDLIEASVNLPLTEVYLAEQYASSFPVVVRDAWNSTHRALVRTLIGLAAQSWRVASEFLRERTAARILVERHEASGERDPQTQSDPWEVVVDPAGFSLVRQRMRIVSAGPGNGLQKELRLTPVPPPDSQQSLRVEGLVVRSYALGLYEHIGPCLRLVTEAVELVAVLWTDGTSARWSLVEAIGTPVVELGEPGWIVDPYQPHTVEVRVLGEGFGVLIVDGRIVNRLPVTELGAAAADPIAQLVTPIACGVESDFEADRLTVEIRCADNRPRPTFVRALQERVLPVGGCERNDELETWRECLQETLAARGTELGILLELRRFCCSEDCFLIEEDAPLSWVVGLSFPGITPVVILGLGDVKDIYVEFTWGPPAFGLQAAADWIAYHLVPMSTPAITFHVCLIAKITGSPSTPSAGVSRYPVISARHFEVGDLVSVRDGAVPTDREEVEVVAVGTATIDVVSPVGTYGADDFIRKEIRTT